MLERKVWHDINNIRVILIFFLVDYENVDISKQVGITISDFEINNFR